MKKRLNSRTRRRLALKEKSSIIPIDEDMTKKEQTKYLRTKGFSPKYSGNDQCFYV